MKIIKYRAWINDMVGMVEVDVVRFSPHHPTVIDFQYRDESGRKLHYSANYTYDDPYYGKKAVIMQYTGLKDINGIEIYEGDILKIFNYKWGDYELQYVKYDQDSGAYWNFSKEGMEELTYTNLSGSKYTTEVIGNIYEHPELLNT